MTGRPRISHVVVRRVARSPALGAREGMKDPPGRHTSGLAAFARRVNALGVLPLLAPGDTGASVRRVQASFPFCPRLSENRATRPRVHVLKACTRSALTDTAPFWFCSVPSTSRYGSSTIVRFCAAKTSGVDDDVGDAGFVFEGEEDEPFGRARPLTRDDRAGHAHAPAGACAGQIARARHAARRERRADERHRMRPNRQPRAVVVGLHPLDERHRRQGTAKRPVVAASGVWRPASPALPTHGSLSRRTVPPPTSPRHRRAAGRPDGRRARPARAPFGGRRRTTRARRPRPAPGPRPAAMPARRTRSSSDANAAAGLAPACATVTRQAWLTSNVRHPASRRLRLLSAPRTYRSPMPNRAIRLDPTVPVRHLHVDRRKPHAAPLRILDERGRVIEPHRLIVEERRVERRRKMRLQIRARIHDERETGGVRLGKSVERKRRDRQHDLVGRRARDPVLRHALAQPRLDLLHPLDRSLEPHRPPQFLGLAARKPRHHHRHPQQLLLKQRHAQACAPAPARAADARRSPARCRSAAPDTDAPCCRRWARAE